MTSIDCPNFQDNEFDGTVEEESMFWVPKKSAKVSDRNVVLHQDQRLEMQDIYYFRKKLVNIIMVNAISMLLNIFYVQLEL